MQPSCLAAVTRVRESAAAGSASAAAAVDATGAPGKLGQLSRKIAEKPRTHTPDPIRPDSIRVRLALFSVASTISSIEPVFALIVNMMSRRQDRRAIDLPTWTRSAVLDEVFEPGSHLTIYSNSNSCLGSACLPACCQDLS